MVEGTLVDLSRSRRVAVGAVTAVLVILLGAYVRVAFTPPVDFGAYYKAALTLRGGQSPYGDALTWKATGYAVGSPLDNPTSDPAYVYPPFLGLALLPLTAFPIKVANALWLAVLFGCVAGTAWCLAVLLVERRTSHFWLLFATLTLCLVLFKPIRGALTFSHQVDPVIMLLLAAMLLAFVRRRDGWAGVFLGLAIAIKPFVVLVALLLFWKGAYRAGVGAGLLAAGLVRGPLLAFGLLGEFMDASSYWAGTAMAASPVSQSAYSLLLRTLTVQPYTVPLVEAPWLVAPLRAIIGVGLLVGLLAMVSRSRQEPIIAQALEFGLAITLMLIFGRLSEEHHLAYLAIGLTATMAAVAPSWRASASARWIAVATAALILFFMLPRTQVVAWGFFRYMDGPIAPPLSFTTFLFLYAMVAVAVANVAALRWLRRGAPARQLGQVPGSSPIAAGRSSRLPHSVQEPE